MIVVDTNVLAYLYLPGAFTAAAEALLENQHTWRQENIYLFRKCQKIKKAPE